MENKNINPIYYNSAEEMGKPLSELMEELRTDLSNVRGKLFDIKRSYGWEDRIEHIEGGLSCIIESMYNTMEEWKRFEEKA
jgi:predicted transcriptional regulator with HTH domain